jgi:hypothetical protein
MVVDRAASALCDHNDSHGYYTHEWLHCFGLAYSQGFRWLQKLVAAYERAVGHNLLHLGGHRKLIVVGPQPIQEAKGQRDREC